MCSCHPFRFATTFTYFSASLIVVGHYSTVTTTVLFILLSEEYGLTQHFTDLALDYHFDMVFQWPSSPYGQWLRTLSQTWSYSS
jgi:hypothetical protein